MEKLLLNFSLILVLVYFYKITRHGLHIWQLENYYLDRYVAWTKRYLKKVINIKAIILGPAAYAIPKINNKYRFRIIIKCFVHQIECLSSIFILS